MDVKVDTFKGKDVFINTVFCGNDETLPVMVLVHGYGGSGALFYKIVKILCTRFRLILMDLIGMGGSSRPANFNDKMSPEETINYFSNYFSNWR